MKSVHVNPGADYPLDRFGGLSDSERIRAEAALRRGEFIADLMLRGISTIRNAIHSLKHSPRVKTSNRLDPTA